MHKGNITSKNIPVNFKSFGRSNSKTLTLGRKIHTIKLEEKFQHIFSYFMSKLKEDTLT